MFSVVFDNVRFRPESSVSLPWLLGACRPVFLQESTCVLWNYLRSKKHSVYWVSQEGRSLQTSRLRLNPVSLVPLKGVTTAEVLLHCHKQLLMSLWLHSARHSDTGCCDQYITSQHVVCCRQINGGTGPELWLLALEVNHQWSHPCV